MYTNELDELSTILRAYIRLEHNLNKLKNLIDIQCTDGTWNYDDYMLGLANGLICAYTTMSDKEPEFKSKPKKGFISDN